METGKKAVLTVQTTVNAPVAEVWDYWTKPVHITQWNSASADWHTPRAENDLCAGGRFTARMEAKDGSMGFDFGGTYDEVKHHELITYTIDDGRKVSVRFSTAGNTTNITEQFEAEAEHSLEMQQGGWQAIMDSFKKYAEGIR